MMLFSESSEDAEPGDLCAAMVQRHPGVLALFHHIALVTAREAYAGVAIRAVVVRRRRAASTWCASSATGEFDHRIVGSRSEST